MSGGELSTGPEAATAAGRLGLTGHQLGRYRLAQRIGEGGMGVVHLALDENQRAVAVKVLRPHVAGDPHARQRLAREVDTLTRVRSPRVAEVLDADVDCATPYVVTRYVPAPPLDDFVRENGPLERSALARLGSGLGEALTAIHAVGVVHRDLKPANVLMLDGDPVVIDFGIAHVADDIRLTSTGLVMGTPGYLSPELIDGESVDEATDWWGWAATMAFAATGRPPFGRGPLEVVLDRVRRGVADVQGAPAVLVPVLLAALSVDPRQRPAPGALRRAVEQLELAAEEPVDEKPVDEKRVGSNRTQALTQVVPVVPASQTAAQTAALPAALPAVLPAAQTQVLPAVRVGPAKTTAPPTQMLPAVRAAPPQRLVAQPQHLPVQAVQQPAPARQDLRGRPQLQPQAHGPASEPQQHPRPRHARRGTLVAGLVLLAALTAALPVVAVCLAVVGTVLARTVDATNGALLRRRYDRGARRADTALALASSPWHLLLQALLSIPLLPAIFAVLTVLLARYGVGLEGPTAFGALPLAGAAVVGALTAWWGPGGASLRRGSRTVARAVTPGMNGGLVGALLLLSLAGGAVVLLMAWGWVPDWTPLTAPPEPLG